MVYVYHDERAVLSIPAGAIEAKIKVPRGEVVYCFQYQQVRLRRAQDGVFQTPTTTFNTSRCD